MKKVEIILVAVVLLGTLLKYAHLPGGSVLMVFGGALLAFVYLLFSPALMNDIGFRQMLKGGLRDQNSATLSLSIFAGVTFCIGTIAYVFMQQFWTGGEVLTYLTIILFTIVMFLAMLMLQKPEPLAYRNILLRSIPLVAAMLFFVIVPLSTRLEMLYPDDQTYRELFQEYLENPDDEYSKQQFLDYKAAKQGYITPVEEE